MGGFVLEWEEEVEGVVNVYSRSSAHTSGDNHLVFRTGFFPFESTTTKYKLTHSSIPETTCLAFTVRVAVALLERNFEDRMVLPVGVDYEKLPTSILLTDANNNGGVVFQCAHGFSKKSVTLVHDAAEIEELFYKIKGNCGTLTTVPEVQSQNRFMDGNKPKVGAECVFPFIFAGKTYLKCAPPPRGIAEVTAPWCSTKTDKETGEHVVGEGEWGYCPEAP